MPFSARSLLSVGLSCLCSLHIFLTFSSEHVTRCFIGVKRVGDTLGPRIRQPVSTSVVVTRDPWWPFRTEYTQSSVRTSANEREVVLKQRIANKLIYI
uniref:Putative secreted protein n=1 Tax=Anopheles darlingi TaxID=43151 RepID=A0A2M4DEH5_ANODA